MKASNVGVQQSRLLDHFAQVFNHNSYIRAKYDGLIPDDYPSRQQIRDVDAKIHTARVTRDRDALYAGMKEKERMMKPVKSFNKEWMRQQ